MGLLLWWGGGTLHSRLVNGFIVEVNHFPAIGPLRQHERTPVAACGNFDTAWRFERTEPEVESHFFTKSSSFFRFFRVTFWTPFSIG
jgi:hypothetical protein